MAGAEEYEEMSIEQIARDGIDIDGDGSDDDRDDADDDINNESYTSPVEDVIEKIVDSVKKFFRFGFGVNFDIRLSTNCSLKCWEFSGPIGNVPDQDEVTSDFQTFGQTTSVRAVKGGMSCLINPRNVPERLRVMVVWNLHPKFVLSSGDLLAVAIVEQNTSIDDVIKYIDMKEESIKRGEASSDQRFRKISLVRYNDSNKKVISCDDVGITIESQLEKEGASTIIVVDVKRE